MNYKMSNTDAVIVGVLGGIQMGFFSVAAAIWGYVLIDTVDNAIYPRTPEYLANEKKKKLVSLIKGDNERIQEKEKILDSLKKYKSEYQDITVRDIKSEIGYLKRSLDRWEHEKGVLEFAFCLSDEEEPVPLMPVEMGFRKLFCTVV